MKLKTLSGIELTYHDNACNVLGLDVAPGLPAGTVYAYLGGDDLDLIEKHCDEFDAGIVMIEGNLADMLREAIKTNDIVNIRSERDGWLRVLKEAVATLEALQPRYETWADWEGAVRRGEAEPV